MNLLSYNNQGDLLIIICQFCGASNSEDNGRLCRKCGALLPVPSKSPRIKISSKRKEKDKPKTKTEVIKTKKSKTQQKDGKKVHHVPGETRFFASVKRKEGEPDLQEIPIEEEPSIISVEPLKPRVLDINNVKPKRSIELKVKLLKEIEPLPYGGSVIASKGIYGPPKSRAKKDKKLTPVAPKAKSSKVNAQQEEFEVKRERLEKDMTEVLSILSKKLKIPGAEKSKSKSAKKKEAKHKIPPANMNEILSRLLNVDLHIEASAILKGDQILASAISSRISDSLLATIGQNLSMIGTDIIEGLSAGKLKSISVRGTEGVLDLASIDRDTPSLASMLLIIFSHPKVKSGIISFAANIVKKQIKEFLGINN